MHPWRARTLPALVAAAVERFGRRHAFEDGGVALRFDELAAAALEAARAFLAAGLRPGDRVALWAPNIGEWIVAALGLASAGGVLVPVNARFKGAEAGYGLRASGARLLLCVGEFLGTRYVELLKGVALPALEEIVTLRGEAAGATPWSAFLARGASVPADLARARAEAVSPDDVSDLIFTSGTTGRPKGVVPAT